MHIAKVVHIFLFTIYFSISSPAHSKQDQSTPVKSADVAPTTDNPVLSFSILLDQLEQDSSADKSLWIDVGERKHLILIRQANGRKERGNVLFLHAQGENADHLRLIQPLSKQLNKLGWNVFIPNIALEEFPRSALAQNKNQQQIAQDNATKDLSEQELASTSVQNTEDSNSEDDTPEDKNSGDKDLSISDNKNYYFENSQVYQSYFDSLCQAIFEQTEVSKQPFIIIANQNAAYWSLSCLNQENQSAPIIFLRPQLPIGIEDDLAELFAKQTNPIFSFHIKNSLTDPFRKAFKKRVWRSKFQRFNVGMLRTTKLQSEDGAIARTITGWVDKQRKK